MRSAVDTAGRHDAPPGSSTRSFALTLVQLSVIGVLVWFWSAPASDASSTAIDWEFVGLTAVTPTVLALSGWTSSRHRRRGPAARSRGLRVASATTHGITCTLATVALVVAPLGVVGELVFGPLG